MDGVPWLEEVVQGEGGHLLKTSHVCQGHHHQITYTDTHTLTDTHRHTHTHTHSHRHTYTHTHTTCVLCMLSDAFAPASFPFKPLYLWFEATNIHTHTFASQMRLLQNSGKSYSERFSHIACCDVFHKALANSSKMDNALYDDEQAGQSCMCCKTQCEPHCPNRAGDIIEAAETAAVNCMRCCRSTFSSRSSQNCVCRTGWGRNTGWGQHLTWLVGLEGCHIGRDHEHWRPAILGAVVGH